MNLDIYNVCIYSFYGTNITTFPDKTPGGRKGSVYIESRNVIPSGSVSASLPSSLK